MTGSDPELLRRLRAADPARFLPPADSARLARLLEDTMSADLENPRPGGRDPAARRSRDTGLRAGRPRTVLMTAAAAAAVAVMAGVGAVAVLRPDEQTAPRATGATSGAPGPSNGAPGNTSSAELTWPVAGPGRCLPPSASLLARQQLAVAATATSVRGRVVTLDPTEVYAGAPGQSLQVRQPSMSMTQLIGATRFDVGGSYLLSATRGRLTVCGLSGPATPELQALYDAAFGA